MRKYGETIRNIRVGKGIKQSELYKNLISKSYAINFEQGKHDISFSLLEEILERLLVSVDEFQFIDRGYNPNHIDHFFSLFSDYANSNNIEKLEELLLESEAFEDKLSVIKTALIKSRINQMNVFNETGNITKAQISQQDRTVILNYLSSIQTWTYFEIILFTNTVEYMNSKEKTTYFELVFRFVNKYKGYEPAQSSLCILYINSIYDLLTESSITKSRSILVILMQELKELSKNPTLGFHRIVYNFYEGMILMSDAKNDRSKFEKAEYKSRFSIRMLRELEQTFIANIFETTLNNFFES
ncbi:Rgg/GadR/MutR family transcriptional regulator [Carnobacterium maltaromaticum]|uniref:Rgg/GadR/MutR family transcriptional regulator n=1 Tax=Carnobacterium maltaromaticum TaxID=2751 RepID=UPI001072784C|nr:Rgg/GadR/MutR family transcriptional regulator [Carnobacterium maltaromaticum]TFJ77648.1 transcriptional regulator [Carnobacterium maltaromaticum]TFJ79713.1 transcriptional regulator [Carnobacterium maltaromaticum]